MGLISRAMEQIFSCIRALGAEGWEHEVALKVPTPYPSLCAGPGPGFRSSGRYRDGHSRSPSEKSSCGFHFVCVGLHLAGFGLDSRVVRGGGPLGVQQTQGEVEDG